MAATAFHQAIGTLQSHGYFSNSGLNQENGIASFRLISKGLKLDTALLRRETYCSRKRSFSVIEASASQTTVFEPVSSHQTTRQLTQKRNQNGYEAALILIRHGESMWNEKNLFTGCVDVPLTKKGVEEAIEAGKRISNIPVDMIYTSALIRAQMTAMLAMTEHRRKKVPIILHNESEQARTWSQIFSEETKKQCIPVITAWQLNERMYGELQGLNKQEITGMSKFMCGDEVMIHLHQMIEPQLLSGKNVMIAAHGNSLRSIIMYLDKLTSQEVISLELSTGIPMLYIFKEGSFIRRGSPVAPNEAGVYAYTKASTIVGTRTWLKFDVNYERKSLSDVIFWGNLQSAPWK
ncbi:2,3-bisphosphoglycerate-dependent phosphoglycerate mutase [Sesamum angolense]|uniref:phosphoglycerate mutase (2,3-diphosphoglycerate-dependent) n=1 Tax=Sesamum angolense TaxID=2727404 RepID=A0AAE1T190_9LAMI|nr:2,3-bisphosphoglycerate-dependent phosphoglycerate mutase [Sesamum angolense]